MTTNRLVNSASAKPREKRTPQGWCDHYNDQLRGAIPSNDKQVIRDDIAWVVGKDGNLHLQHVETDFDRTMKRIKARQITQQAIDRLPFNIRRIAWNRCYLNCDYGSPPRYWLPQSAPEEPQPERTGLDWFNE